MVVYPDGVWYRIEDPARDLDQIVVEHIIGGVPVERLLLPTRDQDPFVPRVEPSTDAEDASTDSAESEP